MQSKQQMIKEYAEHVMRQGFIVYLAESGTHGIITDESENRVLSFQEYYGGIKLFGNYKSDGNGTGWVMDEFVDEKPTHEEIRGLLYAQSPYAYTKYTTLAEYLALYQSSSKFKLVTEAA